MKKIVALLLAMIMVLSLCSFASAEEELYAIRILCKNDYDSETKTADWHKYDTAKYFAARVAEFGVTFELECVDNSAFANIVTTRMAAGVDLPDVVSNAWGGISEQEIIDWGMNGLVIAASDLVEKYDTDNSIYTYFDAKAPGLRGSQYAPDGKWYWFNYLFGNTTIDKVTGNAPTTLVTNYYTLSIRQDWVKKVGGDPEKLFYTPDELFDILKKFQDEDANGNGQKDEVIDVNLNSFYNGIAIAFGLNNNNLAHYNLVADPDNDLAADQVFSNWYQTEDLVAYLSWMKKLYDNGLIDTASLTREGMTSTLIVEDKAALTYNYPTWVDYEAQIPGENDLYYPIILDMDGDGTTGWYAGIDSKGALYNQYFVTKACGNEEKVFQLFDFVYTDEYMYINQYGIEGVNYTKDENGVVTPITYELPEGATAEDKEAHNIKTYSLFRCSMGLYVLPAMVTGTAYGYWETPDPTITDPLLSIKNTRLADIRANWEQYCIYHRLGSTYALATEEEAEWLEENLETLNTYASEQILGFILGELSIENDLAGVVAQLDEMGLKKLVEIYQARRDRVVNAGK